VQRDRRAGDLSFTGGSIVNSTMPFDDPLTSHLPRQPCTPQLSTFSVLGAAIWRRQSTCFTRNSQRSVEKRRRIVVIRRRRQSAGVGVAGFEPTTSSSRTKRATKLRHTPLKAAQEYLTRRTVDQTHSPL
jgi:hypothetical protein